MATKTINTKQLDMSWGPIDFAGFGDNIVTITYPDDAWEVVRGSDGTITRTNKCIGDVEITVTLKQSSDTNTKLSALHMADKITGLGILPFSLRDRSGSTTVFDAGTFIKKCADVAFGNSAKDSVWTFHTSGEAIVVIGGN